MNTYIYIFVYVMCAISVGIFRLLGYNEMYISEMVVLNHEEKIMYFFYTKAKRHAFCKGNKSTKQDHYIYLIILM